MKIISSKAEVKPVLDKVLSVYHTEGMVPFVAAVHGCFLKKKVRYPLLEYISMECYRFMPDPAHTRFTDRIIALKENGSDVIVGKILQLRLQAYYDTSITKAVEYIIAGANWLSCDTIGERVMGHALVTMPAQAIPTVKQLGKHESNWVVRSVGTAVHYAVKKGLKKNHAEELFRLLLSLADSTDFHIKRGIGWGAKTIAKFHPDIIAKYEKRITENPATGQWFKTKVRTGLGRSYKYAHRYTG